MRFQDIQLVRHLENTLEETISLGGNEMEVRLLFVCHESDFVLFLFSPGRGASPFSISYLRTTSPQGEGQAAPGLVSSLTSEAVKHQEAIVKTASNALNLNVSLDKCHV